MFRITLSIGIALLASAALLASVAPKQGGRTLGVEEQRCLSGGQSDYCCGVPAECQTPPSRKCDYKIMTDCLANTYVYNPSGNNIYACVIVVPNAMCVQGTQSNACKDFSYCIWDPVEGCYISQIGTALATCPSSCGDMGCT